MNGEIRILGIAGSLRASSFNRSLLRAANELVPGRTRIEIFDLASLPLYNGDVEAAGDPPGAVAFKEAIRVSHGVS